MAHAGRLVVCGGRNSRSFVLDAAGTAWVDDPAFVPPLADIYDTYRPMVCSLTVG